MKRLVAIALLAGCNQILGIGDFTTADDAPTDASTDAATDAMTESACGPLAPSGSVVGCATITHVLADGTSFVTKRDMSVYTVSVLVPDGSADGYETINGTGTADGVVRIDGVPDGPYWLRLHDPTDPAYAYPHYFYTDERDLDLGVVVRGRDDTPVTLATLATVDMSSMSAWKPAADNVEIESINNGTTASLYPTLGVGATTLTESLDWQGTGAEASFADIHDLARTGQLVDSMPAHDDDFRVMHFRQASLTFANMGQAYVKTIIDSADLDVTMTNGAPVTATGSFTPTTPVATPQQFNANLATARDAIGDGNRYGFEDLRCVRYTNPAAGDGLIGGQLAVLQAGPLAPSTTFLSTSYPYANPYPASWPHAMFCSLSHAHVTNLPGGGSGRFGSSYLASFSSVTDSFTWTPATRAPDGITVGGADGLAGGAVAFDGVTPVTVAWDPVVGVSHYAVRALGAVEALVAKFDTTETSIAMPAELFTAGRFYVFRVYAIQTGGDYAGGKLYEVVRPLWFARVSTGFFRFSSLCGNGAVDAGEQCDPGPSGSTSVCDADCTNVDCGDGFLNAAAAEQCDEPGIPGATINDGPQCDDDCQIPQCNDGYWNQVVEQCDDGDADDTDGCTTACELTSCGNGTVDPPFEQCDDNNRENGDGCAAFCQSDLDLR